MRCDRFSLLRVHTVRYLGICSGELAPTVMETFLYTKPKCITHKGLYLASINGTREYRETATAYADTWYSLEDQTAEGIDRRS